jgi:lipoprotein-anchoring transpeptidase ErfK/SrfK
MADGPGSRRAERVGARGRRRAIVVCLLVLVATSLGWFGARGLSSSKHAAAGASPAPSRVRPVTSTTVVTQTTGEQSSLVATLPGDEPGYSAPGGQSVGVVPGSWRGAVSALPVIATRPGWLEVRLAQRPNEATAWIPSAGVALSSTPYRIVIDLATMHLSLYDRGNLVMSAPAGIGTSSTPTPTGSFFVAFLEQAPSPGYGAFIMVTSAHSNVIADFENSGDAIIGIHGPLGADAEIGTTGAALSNGCIRLHDADLSQLGAVPAGSPIQILD